MSDLHLDTPTDQRFQVFTQLLAHESKSVEEIYILGDLTEVWVGDDDDGPLAQALQQSLQQAAASCQVLLMHGNRDFLIADDFANQCGIKLLEDPYLLDGNTLLSHGDRFCVDDEAYQQMRSLFRSQAWQANILSQSLEQRRAFASQLRAQSLQNNANKASNIMDVNQGEIIQAMQTHHATRLVHGHTHRPGVHREQNFTRFVLGAWERCGWLLRCVDNKPPALECFSLARHYGT